MGDTLYALGRGIIKTLVSLFVGGGIGLLTFGITTRDMPDLWERNGPPGAFFIALARNACHGGDDDGVILSAEALEDPDSEGHSLQRIAALISRRLDCRDDEHAAARWTQSPAE